MGTAFTITTDYRHGTSTGISAADRALTIRALADPAAQAHDFARPGHILPLRAVEGGVLRRPGHTEAAVDLSRLAGLHPGGVLCELVNDDGSMARLPQLEVFAARHGLPLISIADLVAWRKRTEKLVHRRSEARLPTRHGEFTVYSYESELDGLEQVALVMGDVAGRADVLVRVHSECLTGDVFGSLRCDCGAQLDGAMAKVASEGLGVIVYLKGHEGRGIGLTHKLRAYALQDKGRDTVQANVELGLAVDARDYTVGCQILADLGMTSMRLMSNNPAKYDGIADFGLSITARVPLLVEPNQENLLYLRAKQSKMGHLLGFQQAAA
jgi:3,4-dihydroxy 2-butanone 4-phosphate synthase/GTP cyclohydrolase II